MDRGWIFRGKFEVRHCDDPGVRYMMADRLAQVQRRLRDVESVVLNDADVLR